MNSAGKFNLWEFQAIYDGGVSLHFYRNFHPEAVNEEGRRGCSKNIVTHGQRESAPIQAEYQQIQRLKRYPPAKRVDLWRRHSRETSPLGIICALSPP